MNRVGVVALLLFGVAFTASPARTLAQSTPSPVLNVTPQPVPTEPAHYTIEYGQTFIGDDGTGWQGTGSIANARAQVDFPAGSIGRFSDQLMYESLSSAWGRHKTPYDFAAWEDQFEYEFGSDQYPWGVGVSYRRYGPLDDAGQVLSLQGPGVGFDKWPDFYIPYSIYTSVWYYPTITPSAMDYGKYGIWRYDVGVNVRLNSTSPFSVKIGVHDESWYPKDIYGGTLRVVGPYAAFTYWR
jgi:hypothetical protein